MGILNKLKQVNIRKKKKKKKLMKNWIKIRDLIS